MSLTFYYSPMSSAVRIHWALEELGVPYEKVKLDLKSGEQKKPDFLKINPNGQVPAIVEDGVPMFESVAILIHLGEKYGVAKKLWPALGSPDHMRALSWTVWSTATFGSNLMRFLLNTMNYLPPEHRSAEQGEQARKQLQENLRILDEQLAHASHVIGDHFTLVDLAIASLLGWATQNGLDVKPFGRVAAWLQGATSRPSLAAVMAG
jgi:glutathione S-transferase